MSRGTRAFAVVLAVLAQAAQVASTVPNAAAPPPPATSRCTDDPTYTDGGWHCAEWVGYQCYQGYAPVSTSARIQLLTQSCPESCMDVVPVCSPPPPSPPLLPPPPPPSPLAPPPPVPGLRCWSAQLIEFVLQDMGYWLRYYVRGGLLCCGRRANMRRPFCTLASTHSTLACSRLVLRRPSTSYVAID